MENIKELSNKYEEYVISKRRYLHENPELSRQEFNTSKIIQQELEKLGIPYEVVATTGVIGTIKGSKPGKTIMLRADIDALPVTEKTDASYKSKNDGVMHACGHDGHTSMLLGAAHILMDIKEQLSGTVKLVFQPAEEIAWGAKQMLAESNLKEICDGCFGIHLWSGIETGKINVEPGPRMAAAGVETIKIFGESCHGSSPNLGIDAITVGASLIMNLQQIVSRMNNPLEPLVLTIGTFHSGTAFNIVSGEATLTGTTRCFSNEKLKETFEQIKKMCEATELMYGSKIEYTHQDATLTTINNPEITKIAQISAEKLVGEVGMITYPKISASEDFSFFQDQIPGVFAFVGIANEEKKTNYSHHNECFNIDEDALKVGMQLYAQFAYDFLNS